MSVEWPLPHWLAPPHCLMKEVTKITMYKYCLTVENFSRSEVDEIIVDLSIDALLNTNDCSQVFACMFVCSCLFAFVYFLVCLSLYSE